MRGLEEAARDIEARFKARYKRAVAAVQRTVLERGPLLVAQEIAATKPQPVHTGQYRRAFKFVRRKNGAEVYNPLAYAAVIEHGRRPGAKMPPPQVLEGWVRKKGLVRGRGQSAAAQARSVAFAVAKAIAKRGLPAKHVLSRASKRLRKEVRQAVKDSRRG